MSPKARSPFDVTLSPQQEADLVNRLVNEIDGALTARARLIGPNQQIDYWHALYKQGRTRTSKDRPWAGAADLTSWIGTEKVDTLRSSVVRTIFTEPVWAVEGEGEAASRAPIVEAFHQSRVEDERLQAYLQKVIHNSLIEKVGILEVSERSEQRKVQRQQAVKLLTDEQGLPILDAKGQPQPQRDLNGAFIPAEPGEASADVLQQDTLFAHRGPKYRVVAARDFVVLPGHASDREDIYGYAKRCWVRLPVLKAREKAGVYRNVAQLGLGMERDFTEAQRFTGQDLADQKGASVEKEIWEVNILLDLDGDDLEEWYKVTLSTAHKTLLRVSRDDVNLPPYILFVPFPDPESAWAGFSYLGDKLWTSIEEHTALRNMAADRAAMVAAAPVKRLENSPWDPEDEPWGPHQVITVRDPNDVSPVQMPDVPASLIEQKRDVVAGAERLSGQADMMSGVQSAEKRTLGENQMVMAGSNVRTEEVVRNIQESLEELGQLRHALYVRQLADDQMGVPASQTVIGALQEKQIPLPNGRFTADILRGTFTFKPRGSVDSADPNRQKQDFNAFLLVISGLAKASPLYAAWLAQPETVKALISHAIRLFKFPDRQAMLDALTKATAQMQQQAAMAQAQALLMSPAGASSATGPSSGQPTPMPPPGVQLPLARPPMPGGPGGPGLPPNVRPMPPRPPSPLQPRA